MARRQIPGVIKATHTAFVAALVPTYWRQYGALSLFHLWLTPLLLLVVSRTGYDRRALRYQMVVSWLILLGSWRWTQPEENVNWVYSRREQIRSPAGRAAFVVLLMAAVPLMFHLPAHLLLKRLFPGRKQCRNRV